jgi:hypothetical protein
MTLHRIWATLNKEGGQWTEILTPICITEADFNSLPHFGYWTEDNRIWDKLAGWRPMPGDRTIVRKPKLSTGVKHDKEKPTACLLPGKALLKVAEVLDFGARKYSANNWRGGIKYSRLLSAAERHLLALNDGEELDLETGLPHEAHAICELLFLLQLKIENRQDLDDQYKAHRAEETALPAGINSECYDRIHNSNLDSDTGVPSVRNSDTSF